MIRCQKCKHENAPDALKCSQCNASLLPSFGMGERLGALGGTTLVSVICIALTYFLLKPDIGLWIVSIGFVVIVMGFGIFWFLRKTPLYERYEIRAKRHTDLDPQQAIADYGAAMELAPEIKAFDFLRERAKLFQKQGMAEEAKSDWRHALENVNHRIAAIKDTDLDLHKQRAEAYKHLGMEDEYAMEMLGYTIDKEKTFKFKKDEIVKDVGSGVKKGIEDSTRQELQKLRAEIMSKREYGIVGHCAQCGSIVELNNLLECTNNPKHYKISVIGPNKRLPDKRMDAEDEDSQQLLSLQSQGRADNRVSGPSLLTPTQYSEIKNLARQGKKIEAIKLARQYMNIRMMEAKDYIDQLEMEDK